MDDVPHPAEILVMIVHAVRVPSGMTVHGLRAQARSGNPHPEKSLFLFLSCLSKSDWPHSSGKCTTHGGPIP